MTHDEVLMLIISITVIIEIVATFGYLRRLPHLPFLLASFITLVLASLFTVVEGIIWADLFNVLEHLSIMVGSIFLAWWCGLVFARPRQRDV